MTQGTLWPLGTVEVSRPKPIRVREARGLWTFGNKAAALAWARRHAPTNASALDCVSAHPRAVRLDTGEFALLYDCCEKGRTKMLLGVKGALVPQR